MALPLVNVKGQSGRSKRRRIKDAVDRHLLEVMSYSPSPQTFSPPEPLEHSDSRLQPVVQFQAFGTAANFISYKDVTDYNADTTVKNLDAAVNDAGASVVNDETNPSETPVVCCFDAIQTSSCCNGSLEIKLPEFQIKSFLQNWAINHNITHRALNGLLKGLRNVHTELPADARTLLGTPRSVQVEKMGNGEFFYFGLEMTILKAIHYYAISSLVLLPMLTLSFNIDGLPIFKDPPTEFWPILCSIFEYPDIMPFEVAIFCGTGKPPIEAFLEMFVVELNSLLQHGLLVGETLLTVKVRAFVCDSPAKAYLKCVKLYSGYGGCDKCTTTGEHHGRMTFPQINAPLRTDDSFANQLDEDYHHAISPLSNLIGVGLVTSFPLDYMHTVCLGSVKRVVVVWIRGIKGLGKTERLRLRAVRLTVAYKNSINGFLRKVRSFWPSDFSRRPRGLNDIDRWKATELRQFLLYLGPVAIKGFFEDDVYNHFMLLHCGISILINPMHSHLVSLANDLLSAFVTESKVWYGKEFIVYCIHSLIHLADDVKLLGVLDTFGAFQYENQLGVLKNKLRGKQKPLQEICNRIVEKSKLSMSAPKDTVIKKFIPSQPHNNGPSMLFGGQQFKHVVIFKNTILSLHSRNRHVILEDGTVMQINNFIVDNSNQLFLIGSFYKRYTDFYIYPFKSSLLSVYFIHGLSTSMNAVPLSNIKSKAIILPYKNGFVSWPLMHSNN